MADKKLAEEKSIDFKYNFSLYFSFLKKYKLLFIGLLFLILIIEATRIFQSYLFKVIIDNGTEFVAGNLLLTSLVSILWIVFAVFIGLIMARVIARLLSLRSLVKLDSSMIKDLKNRFFNHIVQLDYNFHTSNKTGSLISRLIRGAGSLERMNDVITFNFAPMVFQLIVVSFSLAYFSWIPAVVTLGTATVFATYSLIIQKIQKKANLLAIKTEDREKANISDIFTNIDSIKYFGKEKTVGTKFSELSESTKKASMKHGYYFGWMNAGQSLILGIGVLLLIYFPLADFLSGVLSLGSIVFIYTIFGTLMGSMFGFVHGVRGFYNSMASFEVLFKYNKITNAIKDKRDSKKLELRRGDIEFKNVSFKYGRRQLFEDFNLKIPKNKKVAFVGHSGSGKTTLIRLLYRFYDVNAGAILIDGKDIRDFKQESVRGEMSIVPQEAVLFDDTIYNNVAFSNPSASRKEVLSAMKFAQLDKIIENFPRKTRTIVGERGVKLSGGEKQRVSIARAILANKKILVLDEATSALDSQTEYEIQKDLEKLMEGRTSIIIAHRLSTIMKADMIVVLDKGKIVQKGTHRQLINRPGKYKKLWNLQKGGYIK